MSGIPKFIKVGYCVKTFGVNGGLRLVPDEAYDWIFANEPAFFFNLDGSMVPFMVRERHNKDGFWDIFFKRIGYKEDAVGFSDKDVYVVERDELKREEKVRPFSGWTLKDVVSGKSCRIERVEEYPEQIMLVLTIDEQEHLVPLVEDWIADIAEKEGVLTMSLPEGLI